MTTAVKPAVAAILAEPGPAAPTETVRIGLLDSWSAHEILALLPQLPFWANRSARRRAARLRGAERVLGWLTDWPGTGWQQRWLASRAERSADWIDTVAAGLGRSPATPRHVVTDGLGCLLVARAMLPSYSFLHAQRFTALVRDTKTAVTPLVFAAIAEAAHQRGFDQVQQDQAERVLVKVVLHTGRGVDELTGQHLLAYRQWGVDTRGKVPGGLGPAWDLLRDIGVLATGLPLHRTAAKGQLTCAQLVDRYRIACRPIRDVLVRYLEERRPSLDYSTLQGLAFRLAGVFWADIERHHPGIDTLALPPDIADAWKQRAALRSRDSPDGPVQRASRFHVLMNVRAFYLDMAEWALEDPSWVPWAVPSPVRRSDLTRQVAKAQKETRARMHQRVRERLPRLPELVDTAEEHLAVQQALLTAAAAITVDDRFDHNGHTWRRIAPSKAGAVGRIRYRPTVVLAQDTATGEIADLTQREDEAFWAWAVIETLRHTGIRIEELEEITHLALVSYQLPDTGEIVPLLQIVPSKNNEERLLLVGPELASVLATIITRLRGDNDGSSIPFVARYDASERVTGPPLPHLFQRRFGLRRSVMTGRMIRQLIGDTLARAGITDQAGRPLRFTPHDFRRIFATEAAAGGLPIHIAARLLGHATVTTTEAYQAVFQEDLIRSYRAFLDKRRASRPAEEYREPTDDEWGEFQQHFHERKVALGDCARPYGSACQHEHSCIRCPMLRVSPTQRPRLIEIIRNLGDRISEARVNGWIGEVQGLQASLTKATEKLVSLDRSEERNRRSGPVNLGMPIVTGPR